jgi:hypothetical protein
VDGLHVEDETTAPDEDAARSPRSAGGRVGAVLVSLGLVGSLLVSVYLTLDGEARYAFQGMDSSANLTNAIVVMSIALGVPLVVIVGWAIRHRHLTKAGRPHRWGPLVTACVCLALGLVSISVVMGAVKRVERDAAVSFEQSLDAAAIEAEGVAHLEWMAASLTLNVLGEPEITRESCVLADRSRGVAPTVVIRAETGRVAPEDLVRVALSFWRAGGTTRTRAPAAPGEWPTSRAPPSRTPLWRFSSYPTRPSLACTNSRTTGCA